MIVSVNDLDAEIPRFRGKCSLYLYFKNFVVGPVPSQHPVCHVLNRWISTMTNSFAGELGASR